MNSCALNDHEVKLCQKRLEQLVAESDAVIASVLSSPDGLLLAQASDGVEIEADSVAAMSASVISLTDALAGQAGQAMSDKVVSDSKDSSLVILHAGTLILTVIGRANANMGLVFVSSQRVAKEIVSVVESGTSPIPESRAVFSFDPEALLARVMKDVDRKKLNEENGNES
ncbi:MAG: roadblock/LC7 domain-containing protein [Mariprofundaceae bacterium]|nr:roadblock/LC7 domain-containing protein [Mariprofundaceae bacterium]